MRMWRIAILLGWNRTRFQCDGILIACLVSEFEPVLWLIQGKNLIRLIRLTGLCVAAIRTNETHRRRWHFSNASIDFINARNRQHSNKISRKMYSTGIYGCLAFEKWRTLPTNQSALLSGGGESSQRAVDTMRCCVCVCVICGPCVGFPALFIFRIGRYRQSLHRCYRLLVQCGMVAAEANRRSPPTVRRQVVECARTIERLAVEARTNNESGSHSM